MRRIVFTILVVLGMTVSAYAQHTNHLFENGHVIYVSAGNLDGKRLVSDMQVTPKDSVNQEIRVKLTILIDWKVSETHEFDLSLDTTTTATVRKGDEEVAAIRYSSKSQEIWVDFEKPKSYSYINQARELITYWSTGYASVQFPEQLKKYRHALEIYHVK